MKNKRRNKYEIINNILTILDNYKKIGQSKTRLAERSNLSPQMQEYYFKLIIDNNLVNYVSKRCFITKKGIKYLKKSNRMIKEINELEFNELLR